MALSKARAVTFDCDDVVIMSVARVNDESSDESFYEIITSKAESLRTSDEDDAEFIQLALENAFTCSNLALVN